MTDNVTTRHPPLYSNVIDVEDFRNPIPGVWNDGAGSATRDTQISLGGLPTLRIDTQGQSSSPASPAPPVQNNVAVIVGGGNFVSNTYFWKVSGVTLHGEGLPSNEKSAAVGANGQVVISWSAIDGYTGYNIYRGTSSNAETLVATVSGNTTTSYTDFGATAGAQAPLATTTAINPSRTALTTGVVVKRRIHDNFSDTFGLEMWFRLTSSNNTTNIYPVMSIYNRDGVQAYHGRLWLRPQGNNLPIDILILDGAVTAASNATGPGGSAAVWRKVGTSINQNSSGSHLYEPSSGRMDRAGGWHWAKLVVNFSTLNYVSCQIDGEPVVNLSSYALDVTTTSGFAGMHLSFEYSASTSTPRYMHTAKWMITKETLA